MDELKKLNAADLSTASQGERHIQVTEKNWMAVLNLLDRLSMQQLELRAALNQLLTRQEAQKQLDLIHEDTELFAEQAGKLSERFASSATELTTNAKASIGRLEHTTTASVQDLTQKANAGISELIQTAKRCLVTVGVVTASAAVLLMLLFAWGILRRG